MIRPAEHISIVGKRIKSMPPLLELDGNDAQGLAGRMGSDRPFYYYAISDHFVDVNKMVAWIPKAVFTELADFLPTL